MTSRALGKTFPGYRRFTSQRVGERIHNCKVSKVNVIGKGSSGSYSREEVCLKFNQLRDNVYAGHFSAMEHFHFCCSFVLQYKHLRSLFFICKISVSSSNFLKHPKFWIDSRPGCISCGGGEGLECGCCSLTTTNCDVVNKARDCMTLQSLEVESFRFLEEL